jgi:hypothetical protein
MKDRRFEAGQATFEADYVGGAARLSERIAQAQLPDFQLSVSDKSEQQIVIDVRPRR